MTDTVELALIRGSLEHLYGICSKHLDHSPYDCVLCPLHTACNQQRSMQYTSLRDLMGVALYWLLLNQKATEATDDNLC